MRSQVSDKQTVFRETFETYKRTVYSVAFSYTKNQAEANDIMQDVFLKFYRSMDSLTDRDRWKAWLITVAANSSINALRSARLSKTLFLEDSGDIPYEQDFGEKSDLFCAVMRLPEKERIPIHLFYYEGLSAKEISKILKIKESTIRVRLMRARDKLKKILNGEEKI